MQSTWDKTKKALQWWQARQLFQLLKEHQNIKDGLLQELFVIRRNLEYAISDRSQSLKFEKFHHSLEELSDRLVPAYIDESLPLAIGHLVEFWQQSHLDITFQLNLPKDWRKEPDERSLVILKVVEELLKITLSESQYLPDFIAIDLKLSENIAQLNIDISYEQNIVAGGSRECEYLSETFKFLISGECSCIQENSTITWDFRW